MWPVWYETQRKQELALMFGGMGIAVITGIFGHYFLMWLGYLLLACGPISQHLRIKRMKWLEEQTLRCECGGYFITPWELGFDAPADHLVCDNEHGNGRGIPCEEWIVTPPDYHAPNELHSSPRSQTLESTAKEGNQ